MGTPAEIYRVHRVHCQMRTRLPVSDMHKGSVQMLAAVTNSTCSWKKNPVEG